ncbi:hypothetical protein FS749_000226 [Ceratobasidium sp. UAMH 11750]|nr:hypothetical protein FS749_000226 [Ceratobasidium sp. UAMH 11750]
MGGFIDANQMCIPPEAEEAERINVLLPPATVTTIGVVKNMVDRSWFLERFRLQSASQKTFNVGITVPNTKRFAKLNPPKLECLLSVRGTLASISMPKEIAGIELESMIFISMGGSSSVKKVKFEPASAFVGEYAAQDLLSSEK